jgi:serine/threonine protein kinase
LYTHVYIQVGCILAELLGRKPLFPGDDYIKQMNLIFRTLGTPTSADMKFITNDKAREYISNLKKQPKVPWNTIFPTANPHCIDVLDQMLQFNPHKRISVVDALNHPYLKNLSSLSARQAYKPATPFDFTFENIELTKENIQQLVWNEICKIRPEMKKRDWRTDAEILAANATRLQNQQKQNLYQNMLNQQQHQATPPYDNNYDSRRNSLSTNSNTSNSHVNSNNSTYHSRNASNSVTNASNNSTDNLTNQHTNAATISI